MHVYAALQNNPQFHWSNTISYYTAIKILLYYGNNKKLHVKVKYQDISYRPK